VAGRLGRSAGTAWQAGRRYLAVQVRIDPMAPLDPSSAELPAAAGAGPRVRFGITVGKRNARRAVDRARVKRVLREAARHAAAILDQAAGVRGVAVLLRLKAPLPPAGELAPPLLKRALRAEADALLAQLALHLQRSANGAPA
jgi:RNase P protein component